VKYQDCRTLPELDRGVETGVAAIFICLAGDCGTGCTHWQAVLTGEAGCSAPCVRTGTTGNRGTEQVGSGGGTRQGEIREGKWEE
jgi:hypothetical protein